ncbi:hypothetical protein L3Y34_005256 [Caenorhabditis briggsae]|uniref:Uncharacterized protein n=1 Tax=Caenorhabditis briggsae TaxID=6238 RepID=A0AAE9D6S2_CAEBR|nr:hypothetical protein L3Y34_005256 [Caenorhabditis briggsae]
MAPRRNKPIVKLEGFAMRFKKTKKGGKELWYCVRERDVPSVTPFTATTQPPTHSLLKKITPDTTRILLEAIRF